MADEGALFSVITITRNNLGGLQNTEKSIKSQTCDDYEWIIIDGASVDGTTEYLKTLNHKNLTIVSEQDNGIYDAMNKGIDRATGAYLVFMNAGDTFAAFDVLDRIRRRLDDAEEVPSFIYGDALETRSDGKPFYKRAKRVQKIRRGMITHHQSMLYNRFDVGSMRYDKTYEGASDYDFTLRFIMKSDATLKLDFPVCHFESGGVSQQMPHIGRNEEFIIRQNLLGMSYAENMMHYARQVVALQVRNILR